jgi:hypothetical protein
MLHVKYFKSRLLVMLRLAGKSDNWVTEQGYAVAKRPPDFIQPQSGWKRAPKSIPSCKGRWKNVPMNRVQIKTEVATDEDQAGK